MNRWMVVSILFILIIIGVVVLFFAPNPNVANAPVTGTISNNLPTTTPDLYPTNGTASIADLITVSAPLKNADISSPLTISGSARGTFYFEASFPIELRDASGKVIAQGHATAQSDWMTTEFVPFTASIAYPTQPTGSHGTVVLKNDNPSGDLARDIELDIPVVF